MLKKLGLFPQEREEVQVQIRLILGQKVFLLMGFFLKVSSLAQNINTSSFSAT